MRGFRTKGFDFEVPTNINSASVELPIARLQKSYIEKAATIFDKYQTRVTIESKAGHTNESYTELLNALKDSGIMYREDKRYTVKPDRVCLDILIEKENIPVMEEIGKALGNEFKIYVSENLPEYIQPRSIVTPEDELDKTKKVKKAEAAKKTAEQFFPDYLVINEKDMEGQVSSEVIKRWDEYPNNQVFNKDGFYVGEWQLFIDKDGKPVIIVNDTDPLILEEAQKEINKGYEGVDLRSYASKKTAAKEWVSKDGKIKIYETFHDFQIEYVPSGETKSIGDGVDMFSTPFGEPIDVGTPEFEKAMADHVNDPVLMEAYFPDVAEGSKKTATGEADQDYDHEFFDAIVEQLATAGFKGAEHREFDKYQGVYLRVPGVDTFWITDIFSTGSISEKDEAKPWVRMEWIDEEGNEVGGTRGDYFNLPKDHVFEGTILTLTDKTGKEKVIENPKVSDIPDITELRTTFTYKPGTMDEHYVFTPENGFEEDALEVIKFADGRVDATSLVEYCEAKAPKKGKGKSRKSVSDLQEKKMAYEQENKIFVESDKYMPPFIGAPEDAPEHESMREDEVLDQYGKAIPVGELVLLPTGNLARDLSKEEVSKIMSATWYQNKNGILMAPSSEIDYLSEDDPIDAGVDVINQELYRISDALKRYSKEDGFYHA